MSDTITRTLRGIALTAAVSALTLGGAALSASADEPGAWTDEGVRAHIEASVGAQPVDGECEAITTGSWTGEGAVEDSLAPQPDWDLMVEGGWLGYEAYASGTGASVQYYVCFGSGTGGGGGEIEIG